MKNLPQIIVSYWTMLFVMVNCEWYKNYSQLIDDIDTCIVGACLVHYFIFYKNYSNTSIFCIKCIISVLFLHFFYFNFELSDQTYYLLYGATLITTIYYCITENLNR